MSQDETTNWILMHKNIPVAQMDIREASGSLVNITKTINPNHAPVGTLHIASQKPEISYTSLDSWLANRTIPNSRQNLDLIFDGLNIPNTRALSLKSYGLSLSDQYWLKPTTADFSWESINFFQNDFSDDIGEILLETKHTSDGDINLHSPSNNLNGILKKKWTIQNGERILVKGGSDGFQQEPYNEVIATAIMNELNISHVPYVVTSRKGQAYSLCKNFINENTELIPAANVQNTQIHNPDNPYQQLLFCCEELGLGIDNIKVKLDQMMVIDFIISNTDRHLNNFGFIRDANTLKWQGFAPIYDNGTSLFNRNRDWKYGNLSKPFKRFHSQQLALVQDFSWYEPIPKQKLSDIITDTLSKNKLLSVERITAIADATSRKADFITNLKMNLSSTLTMSSPQFKKLMTELHDDPRNKALDLSSDWDDELSIITPSIPDVFQA